MHVEWRQWKKELAEPLRYFHKVARRRPNNLLDLIFKPFYYFALVFFTICTLCTIGPISLLLFVKLDRK